MRGTRLVGWLLLSTWACGEGELGARDGGMDARVVMDAGLTDAAADVGRREDVGVRTDAATDSGPIHPDTHHEPCSVEHAERCWAARDVGVPCGRYAYAEDFSSGRYDVHVVEIAIGEGPTEIALTRTSGSWAPAMVIHRDGATVFDGSTGYLHPGVFEVTPLETARGERSRIRIDAAGGSALTIYLTSWEAIDAGFGTMMPIDGTYSFEVTSPDCDPGEGLLSPPNFDPDDVEGGYHILPESEPPGLYTRKARCSRGNRLLIDVLYTVAVRWHAERPEYAPIAFRDLNECDPRMSGDVDHSTHDDGTHGDLVAGCATQVGCDQAASVRLAQLFADTGEVCGIIFDDPDVQALVNPYFVERHDYRTWHGGAERRFMRTVGGHTRHFHVRVKRPDGTCVPE